MKQAGRLAPTSFPYTDFSETKLRPVLLLRQVTDRFDDLLVCMVSSQTHQAEANLDKIVQTADADFSASGLKAPSVLRLSRLAVLNEALLIGNIGAIDNDRLIRVRQRLADWIVGSP